MTIARPTPDFKLLFETAPGRSLVLLTDAPRFTVVAASDGYLHATGTRRDEVVGRGLFELFAGELGAPFNPLAGGAQRLHDSLARAVSSRLPDTMPASTGELAAAEWSIVNIPVAFDGGQIVNVIHSLQSNAYALEQAKSVLEARVKERTQDLLRSNIELEQFAFIASHDLQTPLRHISSYVQLLTTRIRATAVLEQKSEKWIAYILAGTQQMKSLITDLLAYSRIGRMDVAVEDIDLSELIVHVIEELGDPHQASKGGVVYRNLPEIFGIRSQIEQLFQNLIENAFKFRNPNVEPVVTIGCEDKGEVWRFSVSDNGIGIEAKYFDRIFLMFHRLHPSSAYSGTGIGLAICKKIVDFHGGEIGLTSVAGGPTTFFFTLPKRERITVSTRKKVEPT